ncbi:hemin import ATP-binding protein HmuV [Psychromonas marina]|uniref:Hemin import ATP-binding protein HmuV n=1 Tax=Psychromonas marina TaxID=88364 RepID=A0ABQ6E232_9GAMM|nr:heme ABC transporter ATP-binding protein [Psychromonas marina]GLS91066.1 hemin import ATP-binding protein HmuV [Psychromonas marina]
MQQNSAHNPTQNPATLASAQAALSFKNLHLELGKKTILRNVSAQFNYGQLTVLLGPNGTGKSSLLKVITQELPIRGEVFFNQKTVQNWCSRALAKQVGVLPQSSSLVFNFSAQEVVELGGIALDCANAEIQHLAKQNMQRTDTQHLATRSYPSLSGGEKQRVHFARVLTQLEQSGAKKVLLLDEPTAALDLSHQHQTLTLAKQLAEQGAAVVIVMHDLNLAAQYADRVMILNNANIVADGTPWEVLTEDNIEQVYQCKTRVIAHPDLGYPMVISAI